MLTRKHPPSVGGMQQLSFHLAANLRVLRPLELVAWGRSQWGLPWFFLVAFLKVLGGLVRGRIAVLHLGDPALAALGWLPRLSGIPVAVTVHGLDVTHPSKLYQAYLDLFFWRRMDAYLCISRHVRELVQARGIAEARICLMPVGVDAPRGETVADAELEQALGDAWPVLATVGRLVERKGVAWFLEQVADPWLARHPRARLVIAGSGPMAGRISMLAAALEHSNRVLVLGEVSEARKDFLLARSDLVIMPNIPVAGDAEGFGLVALEAASRGCYVLAADLEGLRDAVADEAGGRRVAAGDVRAWSAALDELCADPQALHAHGERARKHVLATFAWPAIAARHDELFRRLESNAD